MIMKSTLALLAGCIMTFSSLVDAAPITYNISRTVGSLGSISGTIQTDGTIGILAQANILDWNLAINADSDSSTLGFLSGPLSGNNSYISFFPESALSTSINGNQSSLLFDFGVSNQLLQILSWDTFSVAWQLQAGEPFWDELIREAPPSYIEDYPYYRDWLQEYEVRGDTLQTLGTGIIVADAADVSEPGSAWLLLTGLGILGVSYSRKSKRI